MQVKMIKDNIETWIDHVTRRDSIWYLINQLGYRDRKYGTFQVLVQELDTDHLSPDIQDLQNRDSLCGLIRNGLMTKNKMMLRKFCMINGVLYRQTSKRNPYLRVIIPKSRFNEVFKQFHKDVSGGHFGIEKTLLRISRLYWNPYLNKWLTDKIKICQQCQRNKAAKLIYTEAGIMPIATRPMERIQVDVMGPYPKSRQKNRFIIVAVDAFSRYIMAKAVPQARSIETINFLQDLINQYGLPQTIQTDNGKNFVSQQFKDFTKKYTIRHITSALYNPKAQGLVERTNRTLSDRLRI